MALSQSSKILVSDINSALAGKQDALGYVPVKTVNNVSPNSDGNVTISATPTTVKGVLGSAWAANGTSMTLPAGGTWFAYAINVSTSYSYVYGVASAKVSDKYYKPNGYVNGGTTFSGGTTLYGVYVSYGDGEISTMYYNGNVKLAAIRIA